MIVVGTSGWQYRDWRRVLYPDGLPQRRWLERYAEEFTSVEVNNTFYRLPEPGTFERWRRETPPDFVFSVKASRFVTHVKRLRDAEDAVRLLLERASALGRKLGPVLFQLPPKFPVDVGRLRTVLGWLPPDVRAAWEFRDPSWLTDDVLATLDDGGCAFVLADRPRFRGPMLVTGGWSYVRFHQGSPAGPEYRRDKLRRWAERIASLPAADVWVYFNNDPGGAAVRDARFLRTALGEPAATPRDPLRTRQAVGRP
jgi:uncharacterized protein YecE (DUF72 family)